MLKVQIKSQLVLDEMKMLSSGITPITIINLPRKSLIEENLQNLTTRVYRILTLLIYDQTLAKSVHGNKVQKRKIKKLQLDFTTAQINFRSV